MMGKCCYRLFRFLRGVILGLCIILFFGYAAGYLGYGAQFGGYREQMWLDKAIFHLIALHQDCTDPELCGVLDYTIRRYYDIGPFDVAVSRCDWYPLKSRVLGINNPLVPGVTLDLDVLRLPLHDGAMILVHEALHDYYPYAGHSYVDPTMAKLEAYYALRKGNR
jgi:hypothetical protein